MSFRLNPFTGQLDQVDAGGGGGTVTSFNGRTGAVVPEAGDYSADQITYDNTSSGLTATDVQAAIDELAPFANDGNPNTIAFYNATGDLSSSTDATLDITTASVAFGLGGTFTSTGNGSLAHGTNEGAGTIEASASGSSAYGRTTAASTIIASGFGSSAYGSATSAATILASQSGASASGTASGASSTITSEGVGSFAYGSTTTAGELRASSSGSIAMGRAVGANVTSSGNGSLSLGFATTGATLSAEGSGSFAAGNSSTSGVLLSTGNGSISMGFAEDSGELVSNGAGSIAMGYATSSDSQIVSSSSGTFARGYSESGATIAATGLGATAQGYASGSSSSIVATEDGAFASGTADSGSSIEASDIGAFAYGHAVGFDIVASDEGALAGGLASTGDVEASGDGSIAIGDSISVAADLGQGFGRGHSNPSFLSTVFGRFSNTPVSSPSVWVDTHPLFVVGNGADSSNRNNAFQIDKDGTLYIFDPSLATASPGYVWTLQDNSTGEGAWEEPSSNVSYSETLVANTVVNTELVNFTPPLNDSLAYAAVIEYSMLSDNLDVRSGTVNVAYNAANNVAVRTDVYQETAALSVSLDVDISGGNLRLLYTNTDPTNNVELTAIITLIN